MKSLYFKYIITILAVTIFLQGAQACEVCGCAMAGNYTGIYPQFHNNLIGFRYQYRGFEHPNTALNYNGESQVLEDAFHSFDIWTRLYATDRLQIIGVIPFKTHVRQESMRQTTISGMGDISVRANYALLQTRDSTRAVWHTLLVGAGVKLPTGKYQQRDETRTTLPEQFQLGTGGYGFSLNANYTIRYKGFGLNADAGYAAGTENERYYRFGDTATLTGNFFYWIQGSGFSLLPSAGITFESYRPDETYSEEKDQTGGNLTALNLGADLYVNRFFVQAFAQMPFHQSLPDAQPRSQLRMGVGVGVSF